MCFGEDGWQIVATLDRRAPLGDRPDKWDGVERLEFADGPSQFAPTPDHDQRPRVVMRHIDARQAVDDAGAGRGDGHGADPPTRVIVGGRHQHTGLLVTYTNGTDPDPRAGSERLVNRGAGDSKDVGDTESMQRVCKQVVAHEFGPTRRTHGPHHG